MRTETTAAGTAPALDDRYTKTEGLVLLGGNQALVRLPIQQRLKDQAAGLNTGGFISGYRGSPLGRYDMDLWSAAKHLKPLNIQFQPGVNEDLAATAVWGTQNVGLLPGAQVDGVFGLWYGKGPGVDRSLDAFKHANLAGTSPKGGVLALAGDDHGAKSSTTAHQSEQALMACGMPILYPANVQDILDYGLHGIAMSRFSGCWVALKLVTDVVESAATVDISLGRIQPVLPPLPAIPGGVSLRIGDMAPMQEARLYGAKLPLAVAYARANGLNAITRDSTQARIGIVSAGKAYADTLQALQEMGLDAAACEQQGIRVLKLGLVFPLDPEAVVGFAHGLDTILVVEEKRAFIETQLKSVLVDAGVKIPKIVGKPALPSVGELAPNIVAHALAKVLGQAELAAHIPLPPPMQFSPEGKPILGPMRLPGFCSGCPHNTSTQLPQGSRALAGIGCHTMAMLTRSDTMTVSHMGGEGVLWTGQAPFTSEKHVFANMGDGTYFHSGFLAIRQAVASKVNITYKLLLNGFVSMTGGQPVDGELGLVQTIRQLQSEGVRHIVVTTEDVERVKALGVPPEVAVYDRDELDRVQRELREMPGTTVLIHDQACATERRRQRKRGKWADPVVRTYIHPEVCEGCGDCGTQSSCLSIEPLETPLGRKRKINQSSCNKDFSCVKGFCPSFVTVHGATPKKAQAPAGRNRTAIDDGALPLPQTALQRAVTGILVTGIGGTGVVTIGAIVSMAAYLEGLAVSTLDITGLAQKYGAVMTHMRISRDAGLLSSARLAMGEADVVVGCDLLVTAGDEALSRLRPHSARLVVNSAQIPTSEFARNPDWAMDSSALQARLQAKAEGRFELLDAATLASALLGDAVFANMLMLGLAWQRGLIPVSLAHLKQAIALNGVQVQANLDAFSWGRLVAVDAARVHAAAADAAPVQTVALPISDNLGSLVRDRMERLARYQNEALALHYQQRIQSLEQAASQAGVGDALVKQAARQYFRLLADKDEYEVARLYSDPAFMEQLHQAFDGELKLHFHLGGGPFARKDARTGAARKTERVFAMPLLLSLVSQLRGLRGSWLDPFRHSPERQLARRLLAQYEADLGHIASALHAGNATQLTRLAGWPAQVRGYGHVRAANADKALAARQDLLASAENS